MFAYYSPMARRKSSNNNVTAISPPTSPYLSSMIEERSPPLHSTTGNGGGSTSTRGTSTQRKKSLLGSPFTSRFTTSTSPKDKSKNAYSDSGHEAERDRDILASGGSSMPLFTRDFALPPQELDTNITNNSKKNTRSYPLGNPNNSGVNSNGRAGAAANISSESFFPLYEYEYDASSPLPSGPASNMIDSRSTFDSGPPVRRSIQPQSQSQSQLSKMQNTQSTRPAVPVPIPNIPPGSIHDPYVSKYIRPLGPAPSTAGEEVRPGIVRAATEPHIPLLPTPTNGNGTEKDSSEQGTAASAPTALAIVIDGNNHNQPIFEIFNAELDISSEKMSESLRGHLEVVLRGQEHIGKMHLALENLDHAHAYAEHGNGRSRAGAGTEGDVGNSSVDANDQEEEEKMKRDERVVNDREKGVEEIMLRLDALSETLRTYHQLGTPRLSFNQPLSSRTKDHGDGNGKTRSKSIAIPVPTPNTNHDGPSTLEPVTPTNGSFPVPFPKREDEKLSPSAFANTATSTTPKLRSPLSKTFHPRTNPRPTSRDTRGDLDLDHSPSSTYRGAGGPRRRSLDVDSTPPHKRWFDHSPPQPPPSHSYGQKSTIDSNGETRSRPNGAVRVRTISDSPIELDHQSTF